MIRRKESLVKNVWTEYIKGKPVITNIVAGNCIAKNGVIPNCKYVTNALQEFVQERRVTRTQTVAKDVLVFFVSNGFITIDC